MTSLPRVREWIAPAALIALGLVPIAFGALRLIALKEGASEPGDMRFAAAPAPIVVHIIASGLYVVLGAVQFVPSLRRGSRPSHRIIGWIALPTAVLVAVSGLWMTQFYPRAPQDSCAVYLARIVVGAAMLTALALALTAARKRDFRAHGDWMIRAYALGLGAGTQVLTHLPWFILVGPTDRLSRLVLMISAWAINAAVAEWIIRRARRSGGAAKARSSGLRLSISGS